MSQPSAGAARSRMLLALLWEHRLSYLLGGAMVGVTLWMTLAIPRYLEQAIDLLRSAVAGGGGFADHAAFDRQVLWILALAVAIIVTRTASRLLFFIPGRRVEFDLKNRLLAHLTTLQRDFFLRHPSGSLISRMNNDVNGVRMLMGFGLLQLVNSVSLLSLAPYQMYTISPLLTAWVVPPLVLAFLLPQVALRRLRALQQAQMRTQQQLSDVTVESYNGLETLRSYRADGWARRRFRRLSDELRDLAVRMSTIRAFFMPILSHVVNALKVLLLLIGAPLVIRAELSLGEFVAYTLYLTMLLPPLMGMTFMMFVLQRGVTALGSLQEVLNTPSGLPAPDPEAERALARGLEATPDRRLRLGLRVDRLTYAYPDDPRRPVLRDVSLRVAPGEIVGVFGPIGSGKSTLVNLLNGYLRPPPDSVFLDDIDCRRLDLATLRRHLVTVSQEPFLFSATLRDNVRFGNEAAGDADIERALRDASMAADIARFPQSADTVAGEKGITLSGGQKQRIALARSLLKPCDLLLLDDVLSAVDHDTERALIAQIYAFRHARSLLIVSHRVSVLERADRIVVLERGRVSAVGDHAELCRRPGIYRDAQRMQRDGEPD